MVEKADFSLLYEYCTRDPDLSITNPTIRIYERKENINGAALCLHSGQGYRSCIPNPAW